MLNITKFVELITATNLTASIACDMLVPVAAHFEMSMESVKLHFQARSTIQSSVINGIVAELESRGF